MATIREQIVAAVKTALNTDRPAGVPEFVRTRIESPSQNQLPASTIYQADETVSTMRSERNPSERTRRGPIVRRHVDIAIQFLTKAGTGEEPDKAADPMLAWATKALGSDATLAGLADDPPDEMGTKFEYERSDFSFCRATQIWRIFYQSKRDDAELAA